MSSLGLRRVNVNQTVASGVSAAPQESSLKNDAPESNTVSGIIWKSSRTPVARVSFMAQVLRSIGRGCLRLWLPPRTNSLAILGPDQKPIILQLSKAKC